MKIGVTSLGMRGTPLPEAIEEMVRFGAECTELNGRPGCHPDITWESDADYGTAKRLLDEAGVVATSMGGYCDFAQTDDAALEAQIAGFVAYCQRAHKLGIPVVRAFAGDVKGGIALADVEARIIEAFAEVMRRIDGLDVKVGVENHGRSRYEVPWQSMRSMAGCRERLEESRRMRISSLEMWPDPAFLDNGYRPWEGAPEVNAVGRFVLGLMHDDSHLDQIDEIVRQAKEARS